MTRAQADASYLKLVGGTISGNLHVVGNITQSGGTYSTHAEEVYSKNDRIILRDGAISGLGTSEYAGLTAKKYDGTNDGTLVFDSNGVARVGDVGDEQPLTTRNESDAMTDGKFVSWNAGDNRIETREISFDDLPNFDTKYVSFANASQSLSVEQKGYARANIGAVASNADIDANSGTFVFPSYDKKGLITGKVGEAKVKKLYLNGQEQEVYGSNSVQLNFYAPQTAGTEGQILKSIGSGAPEWVTLGESDIPDLSSLYLTFVPKATSKKVGGLLADEKTASETEEVKIDSTTGKLYSKAIPSSLPASDVYPWAKADTKPTYTATEVGAMPNDKQVLLYSEQSLTSEQRAQVRSNIGAGTSNFDGQYSSLSGLPTIPTDNAGLTNGAGYITANALTNYLRFTEQALSNEQKEQARSNIGAGTSNFSGRYNDLTNKPVEATGTASGLMSASDKSKLNAIASGAEVNAITTIKKNNTLLPITNKTVDITVPTSVSELTNNGDGTSPFATQDYVIQKTASVLAYKGSVNSYTDLPTQNLIVGDTYNVVQEFDNHPAGTNVAWNGEQWDALGGAFDLTKFYDKTEVDNMCLKYSVTQNLADEYKQIARANLGIPDAIGGASVLYSETQSLTEAQKETARANIGALSFASLNDSLIDWQGLAGGEGLHLKKYNSDIYIETQSVPHSSGEVTIWGYEGSIVFNAAGDILFNTRPKVNGKELALREELFSGSYNDLNNKPTIFSGNYNDLSNKPTLFSGNYNDLTNKPTLPTLVRSASMSEGGTTAAGTYLSTFQSYIEFSNGFKICWGHVGNGSSNLNNDPTITFANGGFSRRPSVTCVYYWNGGSREVGTKNLTLTGCQLDENGDTKGLQWMAIGYKA